MDFYKLNEIEDWACIKVVKYYRANSGQKTWTKVLDKIKKDLQIVASDPAFDARRKRKAQEIIDSWKIWTSPMKRNGSQYNLKYQKVEQQVLATGNAVSVDNRRIIEKRRQEDQDDREETLDERNKTPLTRRKSHFYGESITDDDASENSSSSSLDELNDELVTQKNDHFDENQDIQIDNQNSSTLTASSTIETDVESNQKSLKDLLGGNLYCSENMKSICQYHDTLYPDENLIDLRPNSNYFKKLPFKILEPYFKELDDKIENLIPLNIHEFLIEFFHQDLTSEEWHIKIDDLRCLDQNDWLMVSVIRILRRTLPPFIMAFSMGARNPLLNLATLEKPHLNSFVHPCLQASLWYISAICYEFGEIGSKNHVKRECADGVGHLNTADKFQLVYMEGSRINAKNDKEITDASKISNNLQTIFINIIKDNIKCRRRFPKTLAVFGGQSFRLRIHLQFLNYCEGKFCLNEVDNANLPRDFTEMADFVFFYECVIKWALLAREVKEGFEKSRSQQRPSRSPTLIA
ncbi:11384_t:CDS:2 [Ambispora leptoticha]|uniref:11384_t:CDS:1 n=1 Tax=Ambispora leptoticha TaxID=144679 RepID=A0A9N9CN47_9GLOM|nr:11384_t:CDS:2 [Ambispora leptoticha]